jgi:predicted ester cyclase
MRDDGGMAAGADNPRAVIEALNAALNAHDTEAQRVFYDDGARLVAGSGRVLDLDGLCRMLDHTLAAFPDLRMSVERWVAEGDTIVTEEVMEGTHTGEFAGLAPTNVRVRLPMVHVTRVRNGRIVERVAYHDTAGILRQLQPAVSR